MSVVETEREQRQFPCSGCGAGMEFDPSATALTCPYCDAVTELPQSEDEIEEIDFRKFLSEKKEDVDTVEQLVFRCEGCGAESSMEENVTAAECAFCGLAVVASEQSKKAIKPGSVLPFKIERKKALALWHDWVNALWFAPSSVKQRSQVDDRLSGTYMPYWTYDSDALTFYTGQRGDTYYVTETYTVMVEGKSQQRTRQVAKIRWTNVSGRVWNTFDDVLVLASESLPRKITESLEPWDLPNLAGYADEYLSGFRAETYQVDVEDGFERAKGKMEPVIRSSVIRDIGGDHQRVDSMKIRYDKITFKHILLPVWISTYRFKEQIYRFVINARTGEVQGERPWSWVKILFASLGSLAVVIGFILLLALFV